VAAKPPHHTPLSLFTVSNYELANLTLSMDYST
jgi:hypothetical protein